MVTSGTLSANVKVGTQTSTPTASITVNNRSGSAWTFSPASATQEPNGFTCPGGNAGNIILSIPSPPSATFSEDGAQQGDLGQYCATEGSAFNTATVQDSGPNACQEPAQSAAT
jgi:hypothetical protein